MEKFNHPHIVKIIEVEKNGKNKFDIIQEYCELGDLFEFLDKLYNQDAKISTKKIANIIFQVGSAILAMH